MYGNESNISVDDTRISTCVSGPRTPIQESMRQMWLYAAPIILIIGTVGNALSFVILGRNYRTSASFYTRSLAVFDTLTLIVSLVSPWLSQMRIVTLSDLNVWVCRVETFLIYFFGDVAIWLICALTFDRLIAVCIPLHKVRVCTYNRARLCLLGLVLLASLKNWTALFSKGDVYHTKDNVTCVEHCSTLPDWYFYRKKVRPWIAMVTVSLIPCVFILFCNIAILLSLYTRNKVQKKISSSNLTPNHAIRQVTLMTLSISFAFLILVVPTISVVVARPFWVKTRRDKDLDNIFSNISKLFTNLNNSINFFLYCLTGTKFRKDLKRLVCGKCIEKVNWNSSSEQNVSLEIGVTGTFATLASPALSRKTKVFLNKQRQFSQTNEALSAVNGSFI